jgi:hypothetical protein
LQVGVELGFGRKPNPFQLFLLTWLGFFASWCQQCCVGCSKLDEVGGACSELPHHKVGFDPVVVWFGITWVLWSCIVPLSLKMPSLNRLLVGDCLGGLLCPLGLWCILGWKLHFCYCRQNPHNITVTVIMVIPQ